MKHCLTSFIALVALLLSSCGESASDKALYEEAAQLNSHMLSMARESSELIENASAQYEKGLLTVSVDFASPDFKAEYFTSALVEYTMGVIFKENSDSELLVDILNNLSKSRASMVVAIADSEGGSLDVTVSADRLKQLYRLPLSQLGLAQAKTDISRLLEAPMQAMQAQYNAQQVTYSLTGGFAQYTFTFGSPSDYANLNQGSLTGRYKTYFNDRAEEMGEAGDVYRAVLESLGIEGYRVVYTAGAEDDVLRAALPWRLL